MGIWATAALQADRLRLQSRADRPGRAATALRQGLAANLHARYRKAAALEYLFERRRPHPTSACNDPRCLELLSPLTTERMRDKAPAPDPAKPNAVHDATVQQNHLRPLL